VVAARLAISPGRLEVDRQVVGSLAFLARPDALAAGAAGEDGFAAAEARARWLAAIHLPWVAVVNRFDADTWFRFHGWAVWRPRLMAAGVRVSPLRAGAAVPSDWRWLPWTSPRLRAPQDLATATMIGAAATNAAPRSTHLLVRGSSLDGPASSDMRDVAKALSEHGIEAAEVTLDDDERVFAIDPCPATSDQTVAAAAADRLVDLLA
jgi:hypothetical protein